MIEKAINRMLSRHIKLDSFLELKRKFDSAIISEYASVYPRREVGLMLNVHITTVSRLIVELNEITEENRETHWVIRSALHDVLNAVRLDKNLSFFKAKQIFYKSLCENALEEIMTILGASRLLKISHMTLRKYADVSGYEFGGTVIKKKYKRKKNWWER